MAFAHSALERDFKNREGVLSGDATTKSDSLAALVDSTLLKGDATEKQITALCEEAMALGFRAVCVPPCYCALARKILEPRPDAGVRVCTVAGFACGFTTTAAKQREVEIAVADGADEIDFVQNDCWVADGNIRALEDECRALVDAADGKLVKIILETSLLDADAIRECSRRAAMAGVHVIKTSTGLGSRGCSAEDIRIIARALEDVHAATGRQHGIKASGGIRSWADARKLVELGATRLGTSSGAAIVQGLEATGSY